MRIRYGRDTVRFRISETCLGGYGKVRVSVRSGDVDPQTGKQRTDWLPSRRSFTGWVARG
ncbi:hypothetical protein CLV56_3794 [Mumia flava]|uniref:Uncharacterized protein n=1 Tax=Mumia flava TaxID=1348852 RepID=A0A0B2BH18_9ACTN|nr:hypothetical protein [Mumia flava]PJJ54286.1 hypothetical protein CLV56_3794 [Mumia flava]